MSRLDKFFLSDQKNKPIFPPLKWFTPFKTFLKNLFEMLITLKVPNGLPRGVCDNLCGKQSLLMLHRHVQ